MLGCATICSKRVRMRTTLGARGTLTSIYSLQKSRKQTAENNGLTYHMQYSRKLLNVR